MPDSILNEGDKAIFMPNFGPAIVMARPGELTATGPVTIKGKRMCVAGDEKQVKVQGCTYMTPVYSIPGVGTLEIAALSSDQNATKTKTGGQAVLLKGGNFTAKFTVMVPALQPPPGPSPPIPDASPEYSGNGMFVTTNLTIKGS